MSEIRSPKTALDWQSACRPLTIAQKWSELHRLEHLQDPKPV